MTAFCVWLASCVGGVNPLIIQGSALYCPESHFYCFMVLNLFWGLVVSSPAILRRDLKLDNTLLDGSNPPYIKICDFGFAKSWGDDAEQANLFTQIG